MKKGHGKVNIKFGFTLTGKVFIDMWTPNWHEGRGPYIVIVFLFFAFYRGY